LGRTQQTFNAEWEERKRLGVASHAPETDGPIWSRSVSVGNMAELPLGIRLLGIGCHLAELIVGVRDGADAGSVPSEAQQHIDRLNRDFGNLHEILQSPDVSLTVTLIDPVLRRFAETLDSVATAYPDLAVQCESLSNEVRKLLAPPDPEAPGELGDSDIPY